MSTPVPLSLQNVASIYYTKIFKKILEIFGFYYSAFKKITSRSTDQLNQKIKFVALRRKMIFFIKNKLSIAFLTFYKLFAVF